MTNLVHICNMREKKKSYCRFCHTQTASKIKRSKVGRNEKQINNLEKMDGNNNKRMRTHLQR